MSPTKASPRKVSSGRSLFAMDWMDQLMLLLIGVVLLMTNLGLIDPRIIAYWPLIIIIVAIKKMIRSN